MAVYEKLFKEADFETPNQVYPKEKAQCRVCMYVCMYVCMSVEKNSWGAKRPVFIDAFSCPPTQF